MNANVSEITTERGLVKRISLVSVGSTNDYAINLLRTENTDKETIVVAESQNSGKGQRGKQWRSSSRQRPMHELDPEVPTPTSCGF
jgi:hypothetical protein